MTDKTFDKDTWRTPLYFARWVQMRWHCTIDGAAFLLNKVCGHWIGKLAEGEESITHVADDFLAADLPSYLSHYGSGSHSIFVNPPYSKPLPFVQRAAELKQAGHLVVMLLPADKSTKWHGVIQQHATEVIDIIGGRVNFIHPVTGEEVKGNNKGSMIAVFDPFVEGLVTRQMPLDKIKEIGGYGK